MRALHRSRNQFHKHFLLGHRNTATATAQNHQLSRVLPIRFLEHIARSGSGARRSGNPDNSTRATPRPPRARTRRTASPLTPEPNDPQPPASPTRTIAPSPRGDKERTTKPRETTTGKPRTAKQPQPQTHGTRDQLPYSRTTATDGRRPAQNHLSSGEKAPLEPQHYTALVRT
jgi:hypothetical protein